MTDGIPLIHVDDRIGTPGTRSKGPFRRTTTANWHSIDGIDLKAAVAPEQLQFERFRVMLDRSGGVHTGSLGLVYVVSFRGTMP